LIAPIACRHLAFLGKLRFDFPQIGGKSIAHKPLLT
jgi:hypothetical protein